MTKGMMIVVSAVLASVVVFSSCRSDQGKHKGWFKYDRLPDSPDR